jgi:hypothetical protein
MRHIDISVFIPPTNWAGKVISASTNYQSTNNFTAIWKDLLPDLNRLVSTDLRRKCWYSEVFVLGADGIDVDHFRPKSNVKELSIKFAKLEASILSKIYNIDRAGYAFLAFEWKNFRLASQHSNQGRKDVSKDGSFTKGKQDFFPLFITNPTIATSLTTLNNEINCLLDPCNENDPEFLTFEPSGEVRASYPVDTWEYCRAKVSIEVYHLNFDLKGLNSARLEHWQRVKREIEQLKIFLINKVTYFRLTQIRALKSKKIKSKNLLISQSNFLRLLLIVSNIVRVYILG